MTSKHRIPMIIFPILTAASALLLTVCLVFFFDAESGYFERGLGVPVRVAFALAYLSGLVLCAASGFLTPKNAELRTPNEVGEYKLRFALPGTVLVLLGALEILLEFEPISEISLLVGLGACLFGAYLLLLGAGRGFEPRVPTLLCIYFSACLPVGATLGNDSNYYRYINSVENRLEAVFCICFAIYILYEGNRIATGVHSRHHRSAMLATLHSGSTLAIAYLLSYLIGEVNESARAYRMLVVLAVCAAIGFELSRYRKLTEPQDEDEIESESEVEAEGSEE